MEWLYDTLEWLTDKLESIGEFIGGIFESMEGFSTYGICFAIIMFVFTFLMRKRMLLSFTQHMPPGQALFWQVATYAAVIVAGYFIGKRFEDTG